MPDTGVQRQVLGPLVDRSSPGTAVHSGGLKAAALLVIGAVSLPAGCIPLLVLKGWWARLGPSTNKINGGFQNGPCQHQCPWVEEALPNGSCQRLCPQGGCQLPPASPGGSPRPVSGSYPGFFQISASALGPRACEILCALFKSGVSIPHIPLDLPKVRPISFQSQMFWGLIFQVQDPFPEPPWCGAQVTHSLGRTSATLIILLFVGHTPRGMNLDYITSLFFCSLVVAPSLFSCRRSLLLVFWLFLSIVAL